MSVREFARAVRAGEFGEKDRQWFPAWLRRYAEFVGVDEGTRIQLTRELAIEFSRTLRDSGVPALVAA